jgi:FkbM family methyltransferase
MSRISIADFIPPIFPRVLRYIDRTLISTNVRLHPFDQVPKNIEAKLVLDIGANIGDVTLAALNTYPKCQVICFEPVDTTFQILEKRLAPYADRVTIFREALSSANGKSEINITSFHGANSIEPQSQMHSTLNPHVKEVGKQRISLSRLDDIAQQFPNKKIDIMKIDVEGHELDVISGGRNFIQNNVDTIIVEASLMRDPSWDRQSFVDMFSLLGEMGFRLINVFDFNYAENSNLMCVQMDCVFRHKSKLT